MLVTRYVGHKLYVCTNVHSLQIEEVKSVTQVLDQEEEIAMQEFAKFEAKLKEQKGPDAVASTVGKGSLDTVEA